MAKKPTTKKRTSKKVAKKQTAKKRTAKKRAVKKKGVKGQRKGGPIGTPADTKATQLNFLEHYAKLGTVLRAAEATNIARQTHYDWMNSGDEDYQAAFELAEEMATDLLEDEARRRAVEGVEEPVGWYKGEAGGYVTKYSDGLLKFLLEGRRSKVFKQRHELTGAGGGPITITAIKRVVVDPDEGSKE